MRRVKMCGSKRLRINKPRVESCSIILNTLGTSSVRSETLSAHFPAGWAHLGDDQICLDAQPHQGDLCRVMNDEGCIGLENIIDVVCWHCITTSYLQYSKVISQYGPEK